MTKEEFIEEIAKYVVKYAKQFGICVHSPIIAQAVLESGYGTSSKARYYNYFGLKYREGRLDCNSGFFEDGGSEQNADGSYTMLPSSTAWYAFDSMEEGVKGYFQFTNISNYDNLKGVKDPKTYLVNIKADNYATSIDYVDNLMAVIKKWNLTKYDSCEEVKDMTCKIEQRIATQNPCYRAGRTINPKGGMLHSVGCSQPDPLVFVRNWSSAGAQVCVHAVVGPDGPVYQILPWNRRAWHCGSGSNGSGNDSLISIEMTEPATIKYTGGASWVETGNGANTKAHVLATYYQAVQFYAKMCKELGFAPDKVISHHEGNVRGIASNHGDVEHIWNRFGLTMNQFRADVKKAMSGVTVSAPVVDTSSEDTSKQGVKKMEGTVTVILTTDGVNIRTTPAIIKNNVKKVATNGDSFKVVGISADEKWYKLEDGTFITTIPDYVRFKATAEQKDSTAGTGYFRVRTAWRDGEQIGAFKNKDNAIELCKQNSGYKVYDPTGKEIYPCVKAEKKVQKFRVIISDLRIRKGPGTGFDYWKKNGTAEYTGVNVFTIVETADGPGAKLWGLLKSGEKDRDRWIALDSDYGTFV